MDYAKLVEVMRQLALDAGDEIMRIYGSDDFELYTKSDDSPVTAADRAADAIISKGLREAFPEVVLVTEEQAATHEQLAQTFLIVDPLDGTKEFIKRRGDFTVNIALVEEGVPTRGIVFAPARKRMFYTLPDGQAVEEHAPFSGDTSPISVAQSNNDALMVVASKSHRDAETDAYISKYAVADSKSAGSSLKFCLVATGEADLYPRLGRTMEWDTAAGDAVLRGAGGKVVTFAEHESLSYGKPGFANPFFIAHALSVALIAG